MQKDFYVYIMSNKNNSVLYVGVTNSLARRIYKHKNNAGLPNNFTKKYNINKLVYYETYSSIREAIAREKQIKGGSRADKMKLVNSLNSEWKDLYGEILY